MIQSLDPRNGLFLKRNETRFRIPITSFFALLRAVTRMNRIAKRLK